MRTRTCARGKDQQNFRRPDHRIEAVFKQFDRILEGRMALTVVTGKPGIGKTYFVEHGLDLLKPSNITYVSGKFRHYDQNSFVAVSEVIEQTVRYLLTLPSEALKNIIDDLYQLLGSERAIIIFICPELINNWRVFVPDLFFYCIYL